MVSQAQAWQWPLTASDIASDARNAFLGAAGASASWETLSAEAVRVALWSQCQFTVQSSLVDVAASTRDILILARSLILPFRHSEPSAGTEPEDAGMQGFDDSTTDEASMSRDVLELLADQGDVQPLAGGRWLPGPLRLVTVVSGRLFLLVGCQPTRSLPTDMQRSLQFCGTFRRVSHVAPALDPNELTTHVNIPLQPLTQWLGPTPLTLPALLDWMHSTQLAALVDSEGAAAAGIEIYMPTVDKPQSLRWRPLRNLARDDRYLLRQRTPWGGTRYSFGEVHHGRLTAQSGTIPPDNAHRLRYALDQAARTPTRAEWSPEKGVLVLSSELPSRERKLLAALGTLEVDSTQYYPRRWTHLPPTSASPVERTLTALGIQMIVR